MEFSMEKFNDHSLASALLTAFLAWLLYSIGQAIHRLYFSPIANFPGPRLAAVSFWYEIYYDVYLGGQYTFKIIRLHEEYGPIIRINPYELHVSSPDFIEKLYAGPGNRRDRWGWFTKQFGMPDATFGSNDHDTHRMRRQAINPFFSKLAVRNLQPMIDERVEALLTRFREFRASGKPIILDHAFSAYTNDIAHEYTFGHSDHRVDQHDFEPKFHAASVAGSSGGCVIKHWPWTLFLMQSLPDRFMTWLDPNMSSFFDLLKGIRKQIQEMKSVSSDSKDTDHRTILYEILNSDLPPKEKSDKRLAQDGQAMIVAGTVTTSWALCLAAYYLISQPETLKKLKKELSEALDGPNSIVPLAVLEKLPYLTGCVQECIRLSYGACTRLQRIAPDETLVFNDGKKDWFIPPGTPVGMTSVQIHHDESIFPESRKFLPERWIDNPRLFKYVLSFSKGTRQCVGINLAYAELYVVLARMFRGYGSKETRFEDDVGYLELFETTAEDVELTRDIFIPVAKAGSKGVRIAVK
ncbi:Cytochrome P450 monooxygenase sdnE [Lachnellula suecica]|uniref:Cytochrome P450 monooxygenase sdnE n=1 Tax=Lachnellula suecica TaxID=602035 RepID=A0A8T9C3F9_9HELO|nr:Cytochrome P450 monooxygenase sdnE [Lachnellula suecica]